VNFNGFGLSATDTGCVVESVVEVPKSNPAVYTPNTLLVTSPTCSIISPTTAQGSFVVGPYATTNINWTVQVRGTPVNDIVGAVFNATASVAVTPTSGTINSVFTYTGSGFSSAATACTAVIIPPFPATAPGCYINGGTGQVSGSVIAPTNAVPGTYGITITDNTGKTATGIFTVGTPSAFVQLDPNPVNQGQPVGVAASGFNPNDTYCTITAGTGGPKPWVGTDGSGTPPTCAISGGYASGSFTVSNTAPGGFYLITITGYSQIPGNNVTRGDFASNFLGINLASTITTASSTTTTTTSTTSQTTTTTSMATTYSYSSSTYSTTGIFFTTYSNYVVSTWSGLTTTTWSQTTSTSVTQTTVSVTTSTIFTTVSCGPLPCGFALGPGVMNLGPFPDNVGFLAVLLLIMPMFLRRLFG